MVGYWPEGACEDVVIIPGGRQVRRRESRQEEVDLRRSQRLATSRLSAAQRLAQETPEQRYTNNVLNLDNGVHDLDNGIHVVQMYFQTYRERRLATSREAAADRRAHHLYITV